MRPIAALALSVLAITVELAVADPPPVMTHQGRVQASGVNVDGTGHFKFALIAGAGPETFWTNDGTGLGTGLNEPAAATAVTVIKGHYAVLLGAPPMPALPIEAFASEPDLRLRIWFALAAGGPFELLAPDHRVTSVGYAFSASTADSLTPGYETGSGAELVMTGIGGGGELVLEANFTQRFGSAPGLSLGAGWTLDGASESGFTARTGFAPRVVDPGGLVGSYGSLAVIGGRPAISYRDEGEGDLLFARASDRSGADWPPSSIVRVAGFGFDDVGYYSSLAEVAGRPAIAYYDAGAGDLMFIRAGNATGSAWPSAAVRVDGAGANVGRDCSLAVVGGVPAISYTSPNTGEIWFAWAADPEGTAWPASNLVAIEGSLGDYRQFTSLRAVGGVPGIATYNATSGDLRYLYLSGTDPADPADWTGVDVDSAGDVGQSPSLAIVGGLPAIAYGTAAGSLRFARANDALGASWNASVAISGSGRNCSLAEVGGRPAISFHHASVGDLIFAWAGDSAGSTWPGANQVAADAGPAIVGTHSSLAVVDGLPGIAYRDESGSALKYAALPPADWTANVGSAAPILASGVKPGAIRETMLAPELGVWARSGDDLFYDQGRVGVGRLSTQNSLEVEGNASKTTAGSWAANSDARIKTEVREVEGALAKIRAVRLVEFEYLENYRAAHPSIEAGRRYPNVIAQEFAEVFPDWVRPSGERVPGSEEEILQADTYPLTIYSAAAIQELAAENAALRERIEKLEAALKIASPQPNAPLSSPR